MSSSSSDPRPHSVWEDWSASTDAPSAPLSPASPVAHWFEREPESDAVAAASPAVSEAAAPATTPPAPGASVGEETTAEPGRLRALTGALTGLWWLTAIVLGLRALRQAPVLLTWGDAVAAVLLVAGSALLLAMVRRLDRSPWPFTLVFAVLLVLVVASASLVKGVLLAVSALVAWLFVVGLIVGGVLMWGFFVQLHPKVGLLT